MWCRQTGRRERRKLETRKALIDAALDLVLEHGLDGVTVDMITQVAGVSPRTFFNYFASKDDALLSTGELDGVVQALDARPAGEEPLPALRAAIVEYASLVVEDAEQWRKRAEVMATYPQLKARLVAAFEPIEQVMVEVIAGRCGQDPERELYPSLLCASALSAARVATRRWLDDGCRRPLSSFIDEAFDLLEQGLRPLPPSNPPSRTKR
jgi:AcrR family transcriptional regulator